MTNLESIFKSRDISLPTKVRLVKAMVFPVVMYGLRFWLWRKLSAEELMFLNCGVGEDSWESLGLPEIQPVNPKENQSWIFIGRTDIEAATPIFWPPDAKSWLIWKDPDAGEDWGKEEKVMTEDEMVGWHHWLDGHVFGWTPRVGDGQGGLECCGSWSLKESDTTERLNWTELTIIVLLSISPFMSVSVCLKYWGAPMFGAYICTIVMSSSWINPWSLCNVPAYLL